MNLDQAKTLLETALNHARHLGDQRWELGKALHAIKVAKTPDNVPVWVHWGYSYWGQFLAAEVAPLCGLATSSACERIYARFAMLENSARALGYSKMMAILSVPKEHTVKWTLSADKWSVKDLSASVVAARLLNCMGDPKRAYENRHRRPKRLRASKTRAYVGLSIKQQSAFDWAERFGRAILGPKAKPADAVAACLGQFENLSKTGRAGAGWNDTAARQVAA